MINEPFFVVPILKATGLFRFAAPQSGEISCDNLSVAVHACSSYWDADLNRHEGYFWPEPLHVRDALGLPDLREPAFQ